MKKCRYCGTPQSDERHTCVDSGKVLPKPLSAEEAEVIEDALDDRLDAAASMNAAGDRITVSLVNTDLYEAKTVRLQLPQGDWQVEAADVLTAADVHDSNSFEDPLRVCAAPFAADPGALCLPPHSLVRICLKK